jgi:hypothetical protein
MYHLMRADYLERVRRSGFLIILASTVLAGYIFTPAANAGYASLTFSAENSTIWYRGVYNSAWVATQVALWAAVWLTLTGFFFVRDAVERDVQTGVGQIIATTPLPRIVYLLGKMLSNLAVLASVLATLVVATVAMQLLRGESTHLDLWQLLSPFIFMLLPAVMVVAALAVLFECVAWLRGTVGSVVYIFFYFFMVFLSFGDGQAVNPFVDLLGVSYSIQQMQAALHTAVPGFQGGLNVGISPTSTFPHTFVWQGNQWTWDVVSSRLLWCAIAVAIVIIAAFFFSRFDVATERRRGETRAVALPLEEERPEERVASTEVHLTPLPARSRSGLRALSVILSGELRLLCKEVPWWWYIGALLWIVLCLFLPFGIAHDYLFPIAWLWPLPIWSSLGGREKRHHTQQLIFSAPRLLLRQLPLLYLAGVCITLFAASGMLARFILIGDLPSLTALLAAMCFIPALALFTGVWTSGRRLFELVYVIVWYIGAINRTPVLDFMGITNASLSMGIPFFFGALVLLLLPGAIYGRKLQMNV